MEIPVGLQKGLYLLKVQDLAGNASTFKIIIDLKTLFALL